MFLLAYILDKESADPSEKNNIVKGAGFGVLTTACICGWRAYAVLASTHKGARQYDNLAYVLAFSALVSGMVLARLCRCIPRNLARVKGS